MNKLVLTREELEKLWDEEMNLQQEEWRPSFERLFEAINLTTVKKVVGLIDEGMVETPAYPQLYLFNKAKWQEIKKALEEG